MPATALQKLSGKVMEPVTASGWKTRPASLERVEDWDRDRERGQMDPVDGWYSPKTGDGTRTGRQMGPVDGDGPQTGDGSGTGTGNGSGNSKWMEPRRLAERELDGVWATDMSGKKTQLIVMMPRQPQLMDQQPQLELQMLRALEPPKAEL